MHGKAKAQNKFKQEPLKAVGACYSSSFMFFERGIYRCQENHRGLMCVYKEGYVFGNVGQKRNPPCICTYSLP